MNDRIVERLGRYQPGEEKSQHTIRLRARPLKDKDLHGLGQMFGPVRQNDQYEELERTLCQVVLRSWKEPVSAPARAL